MSPIKGPSLIFFNGKSGLQTNSETFMSVYLFMWGLFTFFMWIGTWKTKRELQVVFITLTILFGMLAARDDFGWKGDWAVLTGYGGVLCDASAIYYAMSQVLNENFGRTVLPVGAK
jgi:hypothetical protein